MPLLDLLYPVVKPWLFRLEAERAHEWTTHLLRVMHGTGLLAAARPLTGSTPVKVLGLVFPNVLGLAAGMDKSATAVAAWEALGFGAVEVGTLTPRPQLGNAQPRLFRLPEHRALINRMGFNNPGIDAAVARLQQRWNGAVIGVNIGKNFDTPNAEALNDYLYCLRAAYPVADYLTVNISSPNTKGLRDLQAEAPVRELLAGLKEEQARQGGRSGRVVPLLVKIAPDLDDIQIEGLARVFNELEVDGVIATNTTVSRAGLQGHPVAREVGGLSGEPLRERAGQVLRQFRTLMDARIPLIGVGGIACRADAEARLDAGASLVQVYTAMVFKGPALVREILAVKSNAL